ncbi:MAG: discoidin domain-containing protein [Opitutaceae bacterium]|nr:discoidin domain-containing protein [Opitutaceae bacterium]
MISPEYRKLDGARHRLEAALLELPSAPQNEQSARIGWKVFGFGDALPVRQWVEIDLGSAQAIDAIALIPVDAPTNSASEPGVGFPRRFRVELEDDGGSLAVIADFTGADFPNPGILPVLLPARGTMARRVRVVMSKPWGRNQYYTYALGEIMVLNGNRNLATGLTGVTVRTSGSLESAPAWSRENLIDGQSTVGAPLRKSGNKLAHGWQSAQFPSPTAVAWAQIDLGEIRRFDEVRLLPTKLTHYSVHQGYGFPGKIRVEVADDAAFVSSRVLADWTARVLDNPAFNPVTVPGDGIPARYVRVTATELWPRAENAWVFALAELQVYQGDKNVAFRAPVTASGAPTGESSNFRPDYLTDGMRGALELIEWPVWLGMLSRRRELLYEIAGVRARQAEIQPGLVRVLGWTLSSVVTLVVAGAILAFYRARRAQSLAVAALQRRIAGDLHDEIGSNLASIAMLSELGERQDVVGAARDLGEIRRLAKESSAAMRDLVWLIQPGPHDAPRLADRLRAAARRLLSGLEWQFEISGMDAAPSLDVQRHLLLALKEMLHNVLRHAGARQVEIHLTVRAGQFTLEVRDDGRGFDVSGPGGGHGFTSLRHRATLLQGQFTLESRPGHGTRVALTGLLRTAGEPTLRETK